MIWVRQAKRMLYACQDRYGDIFTIRTAYDGDRVMLGNPDAVKQVFTGDPKIFHAGEAGQVLLPLVGENSVLVLDEERHLRERKLMLPPFHGERMKSYEEAIGEIARAEIESWPIGVPYKLRSRMQALTLEVILRVIFGADADEGDTLVDLRNALRDFLDLITDSRFLVMVLIAGQKRYGRIPVFRRRIDRVDKLIFRLISARRRAGDAEERNDVLSMLIGARHDDGSGMSDQELRDELITFLGAGHETTATSLAWAVERLVRHPEELERLRAEVDEDRNEYLTATIQETLRVRPVLPLVMRCITEPVEIGGYELPAGSKVMPSAHLLHRNPEIYPDPERFRPERFLDNPPGTYTWIPFGGGVRRCPGAAFAQLEMTVVLRELMKCRQIAPVDPKPEVIRRRGVTEGPHHDARVILS